MCSAGAGGSQYPGSKYPGWRGNSSPKLILRAAQSWLLIKAQSCPPSPLHLPPAPHPVSPRGTRGTSSNHFHSTPLPIHSHWPFTSRQAGPRLPGVGPSPIGQALPQPPLLTHPSYCHSGTGNSQDFSLLQRYLFARACLLLHYSQQPSKESA